MTEYLTPQQLKAFRELIDPIMADYKAEANERIAQYQSGLLTWGQLGISLKILSEYQERKILEIRKLF